MKFPFVVGAAAASLIMLTAAAKAQQLEPYGPWGSWNAFQQNQIFSPGPPSKTGSHFGPRFMTDASFGYFDAMRYDWR
jgi:hypothetical protein